MRNAGVRHQDIASMARRSYDMLMAAVRKDLLFFVERMCMIEDKDSVEGLVHFKLWPQQREALAGIRDNRRSIILKARQLGITWLVICYEVWKILTEPGYTVIALSRTEKEAMELVRRVGVVLDNQPLSRRKTDWYGAKHTVTALTVTVERDGKSSTFMAFPSSQNVGRSFTANLLILDEWAFQQFAAEIWQAVLPIVNRPTGGQVIGLSTIKLGSLFADLWQTADNGFHKIFIPWTADPRRDEAWYRETMANYGSEIKMMQEYPASPEEAFTAAEGRFFGELRGDIHLADAMPNGETRRYASIDYGLDALAAIWYAVDSEGNAIAYKEIYKSHLIVAEAAELLAADPVDVIYAPPDLWNRHSDTGRSTAEIFALHGAPLVKTSNNRVQGWQDVKEWLRPIRTRDPMSGEERTTARLRFLKGATPNLWRCMTNILTDERNVNDTAVMPHELTHMPDSVRCFCAGRPLPAPRKTEMEESDDMAEWNSILNWGR